MADAIRVTDGSRWAYIPAGSEHQERLERFASAGMAEVSNGFVLLKHEVGPMFWDILNRDLPPRDSDAVLKTANKAFESKSIQILPDEKISFGEKDGAECYSKFADLSLQKDEGEDHVDVTGVELQDGQIVMTIWPESKRLMPAKAVMAGRRFWLELPEPQNRGERCFIVDENDSSLLTVSFKSDGSDKVAAMNPNVLTSWLCSAGSQSMAKSGGRFSVAHSATGQFTIKDKKTGKSYSGSVSAHPSDSESIDFERSMLERLLTSKGLGAVLPIYVLRRA